ncbi:hypothetical protein ANCCAN_09675 [Ancylostoma caninum]|uniref:Netrin module non-TIMP type domain-containing protein n=1 Tax=Ancylostoma caninum TaxID=29170 RepID=A0A368GIW8_ANCCA|nr:hypothetical protein ANCCAN_09675 [Ancylostoma caninum]
MWYLIAFLACLSVVHVHSCCPHLTMNASDIHFAIFTTVAGVKKYDDVDAYTITAPRVIKSSQSTRFNNERGVYIYPGSDCPVPSELKPGRRYYLEGVFDQEHRNRAVLKGCKLLEECNKKRQ